MASPAQAVEEPRWSLVYEDGPFQIRDYAPIVVAETRVSGDRAGAINEGFRKLARYIFGANEPNRNIAMTAPVAQRQANLSGQRIAMTAPVAQTGSGQDWIVSFYMPPSMRLEDAPRPLDQDVSLHQSPARRIAIVRFSGFASQDNLERHAQRLRQNLAARGQTALGPISYNFYDPPWTLPWTRRNEVMVEIQS
ncbi:hypothetical protein ATE48_07090 [Candidatus Viadribacter manganicus]|uniref:Heme-binding protein n=2 Tax=Candidatus Viadribacter manganicus TaxID=1759059 RepID=A0A1B1AN39_9PROT|nr:hypothetical protein ATE48_07090 [Candidatus Viadribacter manganicus]